MNKEELISSIQGLLEEQNQRISIYVLEKKSEEELWALLSRLQADKEMQIQHQLLEALSNEEEDDLKL